MKILSIDKDFIVVKRNFFKKTKIKTSSIQKIVVGPVLSLIDEIGVFLHVGGLILMAVDSEKVFMQVITVLDLDNKLDGNWYSKAESGEIFTWHCEQINKD